MSDLKTAHERIAALEAENATANAFIEKLTTLNEETERDNAELKHLRCPACGIWALKERERIAENERLRAAFERLEASLASGQLGLGTRSLRTNAKIMRAAMEDKNGG